MTEAAVATRRLEAFLGKAEVTPLPHPTMCVLSFEKKAQRRKETSRSEDRRRPEAPSCIVAAMVYLNCITDY